MAREHARLVQPRAAARRDNARARHRHHEGRRGPGDARAADSLAPVPGHRLKPLRWPTRQEPHARAGQNTQLWDAPP